MGIKNFLCKIFFNQLIIRTLNVINMIPKRDNFCEKSLSDTGMSIE